MSTSSPDRVVITGANSGIGKVMATELAKRGREVVMVCRSKERGEAAMQDIKRDSGSDDVTLFLADLGDMDSVRKVGAELNEAYDRIDVLANNAGLYLPTRSETAEGYETMMAVNHLGAFLLTHLLAEPLSAAKGHVIGTASVGHHFGRLDVDDLHANKSFRAMPQYGITKLCNILFTRSLAKRWEDRGVRANCFHPGGVATNFASNEPGLLSVGMKLVSMFLRTPEEGADTGVFLAAEDIHETGEYWTDRQIKRGSAQSRDMALAERLWKQSAELTDAPGA